jgi:predicted RNase H-like HicB family nuclease
MNPAFRWWCQDAPRSGQATPFGSTGRRSSPYIVAVTLQIELEREDDGRWLTEVPELPGVMAYGQTREEAISRVKALALRVLADRLEHGESVPELVEVFSIPA